MLFYVNGLARNFAPTRKENQMSVKKKYQIIYADPPWKYGGRSAPNDKWRKPLEENYPTQDLNWLKNLNVKNISDENCLLFLWVVSPYLKQCIEVGESWGFKYITVAFVWHHRMALLGNYTMAGCEMCLLFKKGKIPEGKLKGKGNGVKQFLEEKKEYASKKPDEVRNRIKKLFPISKRIELFARQKTKDWDVWGNEVESDITLITELIGEVR